MVDVPSRIYEWWPKPEEQLSSEEYQKLWGKVARRCWEVKKAEIQDTRKDYTPEMKKLDREIRIPIHMNWSNIIRQARAMLPYLNKM